MTERQQTLLRILNLMQQGTVTPEEAADLIDALYEVAPSAAQPESEASQSNGNGSANPARGLFDQILRTVEETIRATGQAVRSINWQQIGQSVREQTQRGLDELRRTLDELEKGDWSLGRWGKYETGFDGGRVEADIRLRGASQQRVEEAKQRYSLTIEQTDDGRAHHRA
jgi:hypothetical protein